LASKAADSHSAEKGQAPQCSVHHHAGCFQAGVVATIFATTWSLFG
jgi:hypothetical protein